MILLIAHQLGHFTGPPLGGATSGAMTRLRRREPRWNTRWRSFFKLVVGYA